MIKRKEISMSITDVEDVVDKFMIVAMDNINSQKDLTVYEELGGMVTVEVPANMIIALEQLLPAYKKNINTLKNQVEEKTEELISVMELVDGFIKEYNDSDDAIEVADTAVRFYDDMEEFLVNNKARKELEGL